MHRVHKDVDLKARKGIISGRTLKLAHICHVSNDIKLKFAFALPERTLNYKVCNMRHVREKIKLLGLQMTMPAKMIGNLGSACPMPLEPA